MQLLQRIIFLLHNYDVHGTSLHQPHWPAPISFQAVRLFTFPFHFRNPCALHPHDIKTKFSIIHKHYDNVGETGARCNKFHTILRVHWCLIITLRNS